MEITLNELLGLSTACFGAGVGVGYILKQPTITHEKSKCNVLATHKDNTRWNKALDIGRTFKNGKCRSVSCPYIDEAKSLCTLAKSRCVLLH